MASRTNDGANGPPAPIVEFVDFTGAEAIRDEWQALLSRALEPNIFTEPAFALAAAQHLAEAWRPRFALVRERDGGALLGLWLVESRPRPFASGIVRGWLGAQAVLGMPLLDRTRAADALDALLHAVAGQWGPRSLLLFPHVLRSGPTYGLLVSRALATDRTWSGLSPHARAVLRAGEAPADCAGSEKRRKKLARQKRQLEKRGEIGFGSATTPEEIRVATERFLVLEAAGWKGRRATALLCDPGAATFVRTMTRQFAHAGQCRIDSLHLDGQPIAMAIVLKGAGRAYFWKIAFDETFAAASPGVQLAAEVTRRQLDDPEVAVTDSCAVAGHPMIEKLWSAREDLVDVVVAASPGEGGAAGALARERLRRRAREWAKGIVRTVRSKGRAGRPLPGEARPPTCGR